MLVFLTRRLGVMILTMLCLTLIVFYLVNLDPNLRKLAISQTEMHATSEQLESWLVKNGYRRPFLERYAAWLGLWPKPPYIDPDTGKAVPRFSWCDEAATAVFSGVLQGDLGCSTKFKVKVSHKLGPALMATGILMFWVMIVMIPVALFVGIVSGMREGSRTDRALSILSIATTSTPEYVSGVVLTIIFATWLGWLNGSAAAATEGKMSFYNFTLPVVTVAIYGMGYVARMTRASMIEVMSAAIYPHRAPQRPKFRPRRPAARAAQCADRAVHGDHAAVSLAPDRRRDRRGDVPLSGLRAGAGIRGGKQRHRPVAGLLPRLGRARPHHPAHFGHRLCVAQSAHPRPIEAR